MVETNLISSKIILTSGEVADFLRHDLYISFLKPIIIIEKKWKKWSVGNHFEKFYYSKAWLQARVWLITYPLKPLISC